VRGPLHESELVERPPHPDPLPASGEREKRYRTMYDCPVPEGRREPRDACGTFVPQTSSRNLPSGAVLGVLEHHAHDGEFIADAVGLGEVLGLTGGVSTRNFRFYVVVKFIIRS
jgi:hypothetical protein